MKVDTDGYDADCIVSFKDKLNNISPVLYWENEIGIKEQVGKYMNMTDYLYSSGYRTFYVFDNYGNFMIKTDADGLKDMNLYLWRMLRGASRRSFYYTDVLAAKTERVSCAEIAVRRYLNLYN